MPIQLLVSAWFCASCLSIPWFLICLANTIACFRELQVSNKCGTISEVEKKTSCKTRWSALCLYSLLINPMLWLHWDREYPQHLIGIMLNSSTSVLPTHVFQLGTWIKIYRSDAAALGGWTPPPRNLLFILTKSRRSQPTMTLPNFGPWEACTQSEIFIKPAEKN